MIDSCPYPVCVFPAGIDSQHGGSAAVRPQCCSYCKVLLGNGVRIVKQLKQVGLGRRLALRRSSHRRVRQEVTVCSVYRRVSPDQDPLCCSVVPTALLYTHLRPRAKPLETR